VRLRRGAHDVQDATCGARSARNALVERATRR
jgi:hypothetical protein